MGRFAALGIAISFGLSAVGAVAAADPELPGQNSCQVVDVTDEGSTTERTVVEGTRIENYVCSGGHWLLPSRTLPGFADVLTVGPGGAFPVDGVTIERATELSMSQYRQLVSEITGSEADPVARVVVATDDGTELTDEQIAALLDGTNTGTTRVLAVFDAPSPDTTFQDLATQAGHAGPVRLLGRIWGAVKWVGGKIKDGYRWVKENCKLVPPKCTVKF
jgi:hypothetical protein